MPMMYGVSDMNESEIHYVHEVLLRIADFLLRHAEYFCPFDSYCSLEKVLQSLNSFPGL